MGLAPKYLSSGLLLLPTPQNPVRAEWILMKYMPGRTLGDCFETLTLQQKLRTAADMANILSSLFRITAPQCGSIASVSRDDGCLRRFRFQDPSLSSIHVFSRPHFLIDDPNVVGPINVGSINDVTFLDYPNQIPPQFCGPFDSERQFMQAIAFMGQPSTRKGGKLGRWAFEKALEVYDVVKRLQKPPPKPCIFLEERETFHFTHGDLSDQNILINPDIGEITGVIDWEMAGFRPPCLAAATGGWFNDDSERFLMSEHQSARGDYKDETPTDTVVRAKFRLQVVAMHEDLYRHHLQGVELRAFFYTCCNEYPANTEIWLEKYKDLEWSTERRGPFPFDLTAGQWEQIELWDKVRSQKGNGEPPL